jgi:hypothetical protein
MTPALLAGLSREANDVHFRLLELKVGKEVAQDLLRSFGTSKVERDQFISALTSDARCPAVLDAIAEGCGLRVEAVENSKASNDE